MEVESSSENGHFSPSAMSTMTALRVLLESLVMCVLWIVTNLWVAFDVLFG